MPGTLATLLKVRDIERDIIGKDITLCTSYAGNYLLVDLESLTVSRIYMPVDIETLGFSNVCMTRLQYISEHHERVQ